MRIICFWRITNLQLALPDYVHASFHWRSTRSILELDLSVLACDGSFSTAMETMIVIIRIIIIDTTFADRIGVDKINREKSDERFTRGYLRVELFEAGRYTRNIKTDDNKGLIPKT